jgi:hypothetical protein
MKKTIIIINNTLIIILFVVLLIFNFIFLESGFKIPPVTGDDGQAGMGVMFHIILRLAGISSAIIIFGLSFLKRLLIKEITKFELVILIISALLLFIDIFIVEG